jgi:queuosine precursor transporter
MIKQFTKREKIFIVLAAIFVANAIIGELIGGKLISIGPFTMSVGVIPWPIVFLTTDLINEYFGKDGVRRLTFLTAILIVYTFIILFLAMNVSAAGFSPVNDAQFRAVFGQSMWIIVGSITAFLASQLVDVLVFWFFRNRTQGRKLWLRATGSTVVSQLFDSFIIIFIAFVLSGKISISEYFVLASTNYSYKLILAVVLTPLIYLGHNIIHRYLGDKDSTSHDERNVNNSQIINEGIYE